MAIACSAARGCAEASRAGRARLSALGLHGTLACVKRVPSHLLASFAVAALLLASAPACTTGEGNGRVTGTLDVPNCWTGTFELTPDFFGGVPYREGLLLRIQRGSDFQSFSDGLTILLNDITKVRKDDDKGFAG